MGLIDHDVFARILAPLSEFLAYGVPPGPKFLPARYVINTFKTGTLFMFAYWMYSFNNYSIEAHVITALHGAYGICWLIKDLVMPDPGWQQPTTALSAVVSSLVLTAYWSSGYIIISNRVESSPFRLMVAIILAIVGTTVMVASDAQKYFVLQYRKQNKDTSPFLINDGWFKHVRNTNFLGEMLVYASFPLLAQSWVPWAHTLFMWVAVFGSRWHLKEKSFRRKPGGKEYIESSYLVIPGIW